MKVQITSAQASVALITSWPLTLFCGLLFPLLLSLGFWQLQRGEEKAAINTAIDTRLALQPRTLTNNAAELDNLQSYTPIRLSGRYTGEYYLLDNRTRSGRAGYEVLQVFASTGQRWLINRGWVVAPAQRDQLPEITWPPADKTVTGFLYPVTETTAAKRFTHDRRIQQIDSAFTGSLDLAQPRWSVRLSADSDTALVTGWQLINSPPERHRAYAVQWFAMAAALFFLWLLAATRLQCLLRKE